MSETNETNLTLDDLLYVSEIARSQEERVESFCKVFRDYAANFKIGHSILIYEIEIDGKARIGSIMNTELQELVGKSGLLRAEELVTIEQQLIIQHGVPPLEIGMEAGLAESRKKWAAAAAQKESKND